jgi:hypothetical protein
MRVPTVSVTGLVAIKRDSVRTHGPGSHHAADLAALLSASAFDIASEA